MKLFNKTSFICLSVSPRNYSKSYELTLMSILEGWSTAQVTIWWDFGGDRINFRTHWGIILLLRFLNFPHQLRTKHSPRWVFELSGCSNILYLIFSFKFVVFMAAEINDLLIARLIVSFNEWKKFNR